MKVGAGSLRGAQKLPKKLASGLIVVFRVTNRPHPPSALRKAKPARK